MAKAKSLKAPTVVDFTIKKVPSKVTQNNKFSLRQYFNLALVAVMALGLLGSTPVSAAAPAYAITGSVTNIGTNFAVTIGGTASATKYTGLITDQHVSIDWTGTQSNCNLWTPADTFTATDPANSGDFSDPWSATHTFSGPGTYNIQVKVYHAQCTGAEGSQSTANIIVPVVIHGLTLNKAGTGTGLVTSNPAGINCGTSCTTATASYNDGTSVALSETPDVGSTFTGWSGGGCSGTGSCSVTLSADTTVTATFASASSTTGTLTVIKHVVGGTATAAADFSMHVKTTDQANVDVTGSPQPGSETGTVYHLGFGTYAVTESGGPAGYTLSPSCIYGGDNQDHQVLQTQNGLAIEIVDAQETVTCTFTNTFSTGGGGGGGGGGATTTDLSILKTANATTTSEGGSLIYTLTATNNGPATATNVSVLDALPTGVTLISTSSSQGLYAAGVWSVGTLNPGAHATLTITVSVNAGTANSTITNTATISADQTDTNADNNAASASVNVAANPQKATLTIVKHTIGGDSTFNFDISGATFATTSLTSVAGFATSTDINLNVGTSTVAELPLLGWDFSGVSCVYDNHSIGISVAGGEAVHVENGDHVTCTFTNTKVCVQPQAFTQTLISDITNKTAGYATSSPVANPLNPSLYSRGNLNTNAVLAQFVNGFWLDPAVDSHFSGSGALWISTTLTHPGDLGGEGIGNEDQWRLFEKQFSVPAGATVGTGTINFTADNAVSVYFNVV